MATLVPISSSRAYRSWLCDCVCRLQRATLAAGSRRWTEVRRNIKSRVSARPSAVTLEQPGGSSSSSGPGGDGGADSKRRIGFTCGHSYRLRDFTRVIIPNFERRMDSLGLSVSARLMVSDYSLPRCSLACPSCVLHAAKAEIVQVKRMGGLPQAIV